MNRMKLRYISDLHLEFIKPKELNVFLDKIPIGVKNEICILAGDIGNPYSSNYKDFMNYINNNFNKTFVIPGNHEYYKNDIKNLNEYFNESLLKDLYPNITFFNNSYEYYNGYKFIGSTLWTHIYNYNPLVSINDFYQINHFDYKDYNKLHLESIEFLENSIDFDKNNNIIITHHGPSFKLLNKEYDIEKYKKYQQYFYSDMDDFILKFKNNITCWFYGHTHKPLDFYIENIPFLCNPIGYPNENKIIDFNKSFTI